jgi:hypothetical protein
MPAVVMEAHSMAWIVDVVFRKYTRWLPAFQAYGLRDIILGGWAH